MNSAKNIAIN